ncbi:hypothetical protein ACFLSK_03905 [Chloroflexota bacterium]
MRIISGVVPGVSRLAGLQVEAELILQGKPYIDADLVRSHEEVRLKLGISKADIFRHFKEWGELRGERGEIQAEFLKKCLRKHIASLQEHIYYRFVT